MITFSQESNQIHTNLSMINKILGITSNKTTLDKITIMITKVMPLKVMEEAKEICLMIIKVMWNLRNPEVLEEGKARI